MRVKRRVESDDFELKPVHYINGVPWPRLDSSHADGQEVPLKKEYRLRSMDYLDTPEASPIFEKQAEIVTERKVKGIIDVGCRVGRINDILHSRGYNDYRYMGFDTSPEPIRFSQMAWQDFDNIEYRCESWENLNALKVDFDVDCVIWSGVLLYRPNDHFELFNQISRDLYGAKWCIIQEPLKQQKHWLPGLKLNTIEEQLEIYKLNFPNYREFIVEANIFSGRRIVMELEL